MAVNHPSLADAVKKLKASLSAGTKQVDEDRIIAVERAAHYAEHAEIGQLRLALDAADSPHDQVRARLAIADRYLRISLLERAEAIAQAEKHQLLPHFAAEIDRQRLLLERGLSEQQKAADAWKAAQSLIDGPKRARLLAHLFESGSINKSGYAELCAVSLATASKHLAQLVDLGLLTQSGRGPATRYTLKP
jgi:hypothetical protein